MKRRVYVVQLNVTEENITYAHEQYDIHTVIYTIIKPFAETNHCWQLHNAIELTDEQAVMIKLMLPNDLVLIPSEVYQALKDDILG